MAAIALSATIEAQASGLLVLTNGRVQLAAVINAVASGNATLTHATVYVASTITAAADGTLAGSVGHTLPITSTITAAAGGTLAGHIIVNLASVITAQATGTLRLTRAIDISATITASASGFIRSIIDTQGLTIADVAKAMLVVLRGCACDLAEVDECLQGEILNAINAAHQTIYSRAHELDYFNLATITVTIPDGETAVILPQNVQAMRGPVRRTDNRQPLAPQLTRSGLENFCMCFGVPGDYPSPLAYHLDPNGQESGDNVQMTLHVVPAPSGDLDLDLDVSLEPRRYHWSDVMRGTIVSMPNKYAELVLLPIVRKWATGHPFFTRREMQPQIDEQYLMAMRALNMLEPQSAEAKQAQPKATPPNAPATK